jgi:geranylgeranyl reductase family protein
MDRWDAIIVGAGPAGCAAGYDLATAGRSVLLLDKAEFPRHKACAGGLTRKSLRALRYSVAPVTRTAVSAIVVEKCRGEAATLSSRTSVCAMTVRQELDAFCLEKTLAAGAQFERIGTVTALEQGAEEVVIRTAADVKAKPGRSFRGRFLIGADGVHSRVRQLLFGDRPEWFRRGFALEAEVQPSEKSSVDLIFDLAAVRRGYGWVFPKRDHLNVGLYTEAAGEKLDRTALMAYVGARLGDGRIGNVTGQYLGFGAEKAPPAAGRVFLAGDAGGFADPLTGEGIYGAIASGQAAAAAIEEELRDGRPAHQAFATLTMQLRQDLLLSASGARWFYSNPDLGFRALTAPVFRGAVINAYANGTKIAALADVVRRFARVFAING